MPNAPGCLIKQEDTTTIEATFQSTTEFPEEALLPAVRAIPLFIRVFSDPVMEPVLSWWRSGALHGLAIALHVAPFSPGSRLLVLGTGMLLMLHVVPSLLQMRYVHPLRTDPACPPRLPSPLQVGLSGLES